MAPTRTQVVSKASRKSLKPKHTNKIKKAMATRNPVENLTAANAYLQNGNVESALAFAKDALSGFETMESGATRSGCLASHSLLGEIYVELGDAVAAKEHFVKAIELDPDGLVSEEDGGGTEKFMWMAQLNEEGGQESIRWYDKGTRVLYRQLQELAERSEGNAQMLEDFAMEAQEKSAKLQNALCGMIEVWMTDLSFNDEAEQSCEELIRRALNVSEEPEPSTLQTLASIRLSQERLDEAQEALRSSLSRWSDLPDDDPNIPDFPTRISLARLLMEAGMENEALDVVERLVGEDDQSVEAWYLNGWCRYLIAKSESSDGAAQYYATEDKQALLLSSRECLRNSLKLYGLLGYEDDRLRDHAKELVAELEGSLGGAEIEDDDDEEGWEEAYNEDDTSDEQDHEMKDD